MALRAVTSNGVAITPSSVSLPTGGTFDLYNTEDQTTNYERGIAGWISNTYAIGTFNAGTGANRPIGFYTSSLARWVISTAGHFLANDDNSYDIGASGVNRPRNVYVGAGVYGAFFRHTVLLTVAGLPSAASQPYSYNFVSDSTVAAAGNFGNIVAGGGANIAPVYSDGTNWRIG